MTHLNALLLVDVKVQSCSTNVSHTSQSYHCPQSMCSVVLCWGGVGT